MDHPRPSAISRSEALRCWDDYQRRLQRADRARRFWHDQDGRDARRDRHRRERLDRHRAFFGVYYLVP